MLKLNKYILFLILISLVLFANNNSAFGQELLNIKPGSVFFVSNGAAIKVNGNVNLNSAASLNNNGSINLTGNWINDGTLISSPNSKVIFSGFSNSDISGSGILGFSAVWIQKDTLTNEVRMLVPINTPGFLNLISGNFKIIGTFSYSNTVFALISGNIVIPRNAGIWLDNPNAQITAQSASLFLKGRLKLSQGIFNIGSSGAEGLFYDNVSSFTPSIPAELTIENGTMNIFSSLSSNKAAVGKLSLNFLQTGGTLNLGVGANAALMPVFEIDTPTSRFSVSGGAIVLKRNSTGTVNEVRILADSGTVTGGELRIDAVANSQFEIFSKKRLGSLFLTGTNNPSVKITSDSLTFVGNVTLNGSGTGLFDINGKTLYIGGNWINNLSSDGFIPGTNPLVFISNAVQIIGGTTQTAFNNLSIVKTGGSIELGLPSRINGNLRLISNTIFDMKSFDLTIGPSGDIFSDNGISNTIISFNNNKFISNSGSGTDPLLGARLIKILPASPTLPSTLRFPVGTPGKYAPAEITINPAGASFGANPWVGVKPVPLEHPGVELVNKSLARYWVVSSQNVNINPRGATTQFIYQPSDAQGNEGSYRVLYFAPSWNNPAGYWRIDPGQSDDVVDFNVKLFYSQQTDAIDGEWTAGEPDVASAVYFARQSGDYNNPNTWSKIGFNGAVSNTIPNKRSDKIRIQDHTVTVSSPVALAQLISVEKGTESRQSGTLKILNGQYVQGDTLKLEETAVLRIGDSLGIKSIANSGNIRTGVRQLAQKAIYIYDGTFAQITGDGLPNSVGSLIVEKPNAVKLNLGKNINIIDSLIINSGILDLDAYSANGNSSGRIIKMRGGELLIRSTFPTNYSVPFFTAGTIHFAAASNLSIPSSSSSPGVAQYYNLKLSGTVSGNITLRDLGEIRISENFDISTLSFADNTYRFITNGSTLRFNKNTGNQLIPVKPAAPSDTTVYLEYYNLTVDNAGTKQLSASGNPVFKVLNNLTISGNAELDANNQTLEVQGNWTNTAGTFLPGTGTVIFRSPVATISTNVISRNTTENPFNKVFIAGAGIVNFTDNTLINSDLLINNLSALSLQNNTLTLKGNWTNLGGVFQSNTSTVIFAGSAMQIISNTSGNETFYNFTSNNPNNISGFQVGGSTNGINISNDLALNAGSLLMRSGSFYKYVSVVNALTRSGGGFIDGELRRSVASGALSISYEVGFGKSYLPVTLTFTGSGGTTGLVGVVSDTINTSTVPISWSDLIPSDISPLGSTMSQERHVARQWTVSKPAGTSFVLGANREYGMVFNFVSGNSPNGDLRNSADPNVFEARMWNGSNWIVPFYYGTKPIMGVRTASSTEFKNLVDIGTVIIGEPGLVSFYTRADGNWSNPANWSTQGYGGLPSLVYPSQSASFEKVKVFIGNNNTITLDQDENIESAGANIGLVQVDSSGTLMMGSNILTGSGEFRMVSGATLGVGSPDGISLAGTNTGNIRTNTRNYNYNLHNNSGFIFTSASAQNTGNGLPALPDSIKYLTVNKPSNTLTINSNSNIAIKDSLYLQSGNLNQGNRDIYLAGNFRIASAGIFEHNNRTFSFTGIKKTQRIISDKNIVFYNLQINKASDSSKILIEPTIAGNSKNIDVINNLTFTSSNSAYIDLSNKYTAEGFPDYNQGEWTLTLGTAGTVSRLGLGHIDGELRKNIPIGNTGNLTFEIGKGLNYRPFRFNLSGSGGGQAAGYIGVEQIPLKHPRAYYLNDPGFNYPIERMLSHYWRITRPSGSSFVKGTGRTMMLEPNYLDPIDIPPAALQFCFDLVYWKGGTESNWQRLSPPSNTFNNGSGSTCGERDINSNEATYSPNATSKSTQAYNIASGVEFGYTDLVLAQNNRDLLGDIVVAQQGPSTTQFYSAKSGNWTDPATWYTGSYGSGVNAAGTFPKERLHVAHIGEGHKVILNANIGNSYPDNSSFSPNDEYREQRLGSVIVEKTANGAGYLDLGTFVIRASVAEVHDGAILETGGEDGFPLINNIGNIQQEYNTNFLSKNYNFGNHNNGTFIFKPTGKITATSNNSDYRYCQPSMGNGNTITQIAASINSPFTSINESYNNVFRSTNGQRYYPFNVFHLTAGQLYTFRITISGGNNTDYYATIFLDQNFNGNYSNENYGATTRFNSGGTVDIPVTLPANTAQGTSQLRVVVRNSSGTPDPCNPGGSGEVLDYTLYVVNPNYVPNQIVGDGLPAMVSTVEINSPNSSFVVTQNAPITVKDKLLLTSGILNPTNIYLRGVLENNSNVNAFGSGTAGTLYIDTNVTQYIRGTQPTNIYNLVFNKPNASLILERDIKVNNNFSMSNDKLLVLNGYNLTLGANGSINSGSGAFSKTRMIKSNGTLSEGKIIKEYASGAVASPYCSASLAGTTRYITNIQIGGWNHSSGQAGYSDFTGIAGPVLTANVTNTINGTYNTGNQRRWAMWIDYNQDGDFLDANETIFLNINSTALSENFIVPVTALNGNTRMRIRVRQNDYSTNPSCEVSAVDGEFEDYTVTITGATSPAIAGVFTFPIGVDTIYNPAIISMTADYSGNANLSLQLIAAKHPLRLTENMLAKYWKLESSGISNISNSSFKFYYNNADVIGNTAKYVPGRYNNKWEINLGINPSGKVSPITITNEASLDGDWTVGEAPSFFSGRIFYSRADGNWNDKNTWSNDKTALHAGAAASYYPGDLFFQDTVVIDGHTVTFNLDSTRIDTLRIGGTNASPTAGRLVFGDSPLKKWLLLRNLFMDNDNGVITGTNPAGTRIDTLIITGEIDNRSNVSGGIDLYPNLAQDDYTILKIQNTGNSIFTGNGTWRSLGDLILQKSGGLADTLISRSVSFANATAASTKFIYRPILGVLRHEISDDLYLSGGNIDVNMSPFTGLHIIKGNVRTRSSLFTNSNTTIRINGGKLTVGDDANEHLLYKSGTKFSLDSGSVKIAGGFSRYLTSSVVDFSMTDKAEMFVNTISNTDAGKIGFDLSNAGSSFSMTGGRIVIANAAGTTPSSSDLRINAGGGLGMTSGFIQAGDTLLTPNNTIIKIGGTAPVFNLHFANNPANAVATQIYDETFKIANDWTIDAGHTFGLNGNSVTLGGNLTNYGSFLALPSAPTTNAWQIELNGTGVQNIFTNTAPGLQVYNLRIDKPSGKAALSALGHSNLFVKNNLEFANNNQALLSAPISASRFVEMAPVFGSTPQILRNGRGHIAGRLKRFINAGAQQTLFAVGADDSVQSYRPAVFETSDLDNTPGLVSVTAYNYEHPNFSTAGIDSNNNIERYWNLRSEGFALGANKKYSFTTQYINPGDLVNTPSVLFFEHRLFSPEYPNSGSWSIPLSAVVTDSTVQSINNEIFGDFVIGEPEGVTFYSIADGNWDDLNTWSLTGYETPNLPLRTPNQNTDIIRIGNGRTVTLPDISPDIRSVIVEKYNNKPGTFLINGNFGYLRGKSFLLEDDCTLGVQHLNGITPAGDGFTGAVQTELRVFSKSRYLYNSDYGMQATGIGIPSVIKSIIIDNESFPSNTVFVSNYVGAPAINVMDSVFVRQGVLNAGNRNFVVYGVVALDSINREGRIEPTDSEFNFSGTADKYIVIKNHSGAEFYNAKLSGGNLLTNNINSPNRQTAYLKVRNELNFASASKLILGDSVSVEVQNSGINSILNFANDRFILTSQNSGSLIRNVASGNTYIYPIGSKEGGIDYFAPMELTTDPSGTSGNLGVRTSWGKSSVQTNGHIGLSGSVQARYLKRYWAVDSVSMKINGRMKFFYDDADFAGSGIETEMTRMGRWRPSNEGMPGVWSFPVPVLNHNYSANTFETAANFDYNDFAGDWLLGNEQAFRRIFYSRQNGIWSNDQSWTYNSTHIGVISGLGLYPNAAQDSVVIGGGHTISLDVNNPLGAGSGVALGTNAVNYGVLDCGINILNGDYFSMSQNSTLKIGSTLGISILGNAVGNIQTTISREFNSLSNFTYNGSVSQTLGDGLPLVVNDLTIANSGLAGNNSVIFDRNINVTHDFSVNAGKADLQTYKVIGGNALTISDNAYLSLGGTSLLFEAVSGFADYSGVLTNSYIEFYGNNQDISQVPLLFFNASDASGLGYGNLLISNGADQTATQRILIRGNLLTQNNATLTVEAINSLEVRGSILNSANIFNKGIIEIGK